MNFACWNIQGLNTPGKQREVNHLISVNFLTLCVIVESHVHTNSFNSVCRSSFGRWSWVSNLGYSDRGARIIIAWDLNVLELMVLEVHAQFMHCQIKIRGGSVSFAIQI